MSGLTRALSPIAHAATSVLNSRGSLMLGASRMLRSNPIGAAAAGGALVGGAYGAMSDNTSMLGGALGGAVLGAGGMYGWRNKSGFTGAYKGLTSGSRRNFGEVAKDVKRGWSAGIMGGYSDRYGTKAAQSRFARLNGG